MAITHKYTLLCDDIRREDNGKLLVIGMYTGSIGLPQIPFLIPSLTFVLLMESDRPGHWGMKFKIQHLETGRAMVEGSGGISVQQPGLIVSPIKFGNVQFQAVGDYNFVFTIEEHADPIIADFKVLLNLPPQQQASQFPLGGR
jgi:hypothetical protein